jgi:hypothetical protein
VSPLLLKRASASRTSGEWNDDDFDVLTAHPAVKREEKDWGRSYQPASSRHAFRQRLTARPVNKQMKRRAKRS